jgi:hypothetical protein
LQAIAINQQEAIVIQALACVPYLECLVHPSPVQEHLLLVEVVHTEWVAQAYVLLQEVEGALQDLCKGCQQTTLTPLWNYIAQ